MKPDGVFLSNGRAIRSGGLRVKSIRKFLGRVPVFGICLGHQLTGLALADAPTSSSSATTAVTIRCATI